MTLHLYSAVSYYSARNLIFTGTVVFSSKENRPLSLVEPNPRSVVS